MKINDHSLSSSYTQGLRSAREAAHVQGAGRSRYVDSRNDVGMDRVEVSELGKTISNVLNAYSEERAEKVRQLKAAVDSGSYQPNVAAISNALVESSFPSS